MRDIEEGEMEKRGWRKEWEGEEREGGGREREEEEGGRMGRRKEKGGRKRGGKKK
jgi:hypothetical protein